MPVVDANETPLSQIRDSVPPGAVNPAPPLTLTPIDVARSELQNLPPFPKPNEQGTSRVTEFIRGLKALKNREVSVAIRQQSRGLSKGWSFKGAEKIDYENFSMEDLMLNIGAQFGNGRYQFTFTIQGEGSADQSYSFIEDIDL